MTDVVSPVAADAEPPQKGAQIKQEVRWRSADVTRAAVEGACYAVFWKHFTELLKHRGGALRKALILFEGPGSVRQAHACQNWRYHAYRRADARQFLKQVLRRETPRGRRRPRRCVGRLGIFGKRRSRIQ
jgi:hypothetical protein